MRLSEFCNGIRLMPEAVALLRRIKVSEEEYQRVRGLFDRDKEEFYRDILSMEQSSLYFLYYFSRFACETYETYRERQIPEAIFWDTFQDIRIWCENCLREYGEYGIHQYDWLYRHIELRLFRLGRLQYEMLEAEQEHIWEGGHIRVGDSVISVHIPQGEPLDMEKCRESFRWARSIWKDGRSFFCHSWLLYPGLREILPETSNILKFQECFDVIETDYKEREAEQRIFTKVVMKVGSYPEQTSLQRNAKRYLLSGKSLGNGFGILKKSFC